MNLKSVFPKQGPLVHLTSTGRRDAIAELLDRLIASEEVAREKRETLITKLLEREKIGSTRITSRLAFPHTREKECLLQRPVIALLGFSKLGIQWESDHDAFSIHFVFLQLIANDALKDGLQTMATLSHLARDHASLFDNNDLDGITRLLTQD